MKVTVVHGDTTIQVHGAKSLKKTKKLIADIFDMLPGEVVEEEPEPNPIGFTLGATLERSPTVDVVAEDEDEYEEWEW